MMKSHIEDLTSRGSYLNTVSQRLKLYFETIPNLESAESKTLDLNNELGVETPIDIIKLYLQYIVFALLLLLNL